jgi:post-segregation antitoxin (ccd killing protein)
MKASTHSQTRKRAVNLTLSEDLVLHVRQLTPNLSGIVEELLTEFVEREHRLRREQSQRAEATSALWNAFEEKHEAFSDEYSTL